jgi:hypothetical protein
MGNVKFNVSINLNLYCCVLTLFRTQQNGHKIKKDAGETARSRSRISNAYFIVYNFKLVKKMYRKLVKKWLFWIPPNTLISDHENARYQFFMNLEQILNWEESRLSVRYGDQNV